MAYAQDLGGTKRAARRSMAAAGTASIGAYLVFLTSIGFMAAIVFGFVG